MANDARADFGPFFVVLGRKYILFHLLVFNTGAQAVKGLCAAGHNGGNHTVGQCELVAGRVLGVGVKIRKNLGNVHPVRPGVLAVVQPYKGNSRSPVFGAGVHKAKVGDRAVVDAVKGLYGARPAGEIY